MPGPAPPNTRFIPTGVGNTLAADLRKFSQAVHPHGCGEHYSIEDEGDDQDGSSPRVWGTQHRRRNTESERRFIPTGVGNTFAAPFAAAKCPVHPHGCGEHLTVTKGFDIKNGSSPRVWGTLTNKAVWHNEYRFIPTGVGNTVYRV